MGYMGQKNKIKRVIIEEYLAGKATYRELERVYGISHSTIHNWVKSAEERGLVRGEEEAGLRLLKDEEAEAEIKRLRAELKDAQLYNKLLNTMIDIAEDDLGVAIRKKPGSGW
jgi:transposase-like protein